MSVSEKNLIPALITTGKDHRGVFFGYVEDADIGNGTKTIFKGRMCVYWDTDTHGVMGLAANGPGKGCRVTAKVPMFQVNNITMIVECTEAAVEKWEEGPWA